MTVTLTFSDPVTVTANDAPVLVLNDGGTATYDAGESNPSAGVLVFDHTVQAGTDHNVTSLAVQSVALPSGATIQNDGINANLSISGVAQSGPQVYATLPTVTSIVESRASGTVFPGATLTFTVGMNEAVTVTGTPTLTLNDGSTATYDPSATAQLNDPTKLVFDYTVQGSDTSVSSLAAQSINLPGNASITDAGGNNAVLSLAGVTQFGPRVNAAAQISSITETPATGDFNAGKSVTFTVAFDEAVTATGTPQLALNDGGTAFYDPTATAALGNDSELAFDYTVGASDTDLPALTVSSVVLPTGAAVTANGNPAALSLTGVSMSGPQIDTTIPAVTSAAASPATGDDGIGDTVTITLTMNEAVTVNGGQPTLSLNDGGTAYLVGASGNTLTFSYTVGAGDRSVTGLAITGYDLHGATIADGAGNTASLAGAVTTYPSLQIDTAPPTVTAVAAASDNGSTDLGAGRTVTITVSTSKTVYVSGHPTLLLNDNETAAYVTGTGTSTLTFSYVVRPGDNQGDLQVTGVSLANGNIKDAAGNPLAGGASADLGLQIDTTAPTATVSATTDDGATLLNAGHTITITVATSEDVTVTGTPRLTLSDNEVAAYVGGSGTKALTFEDTVANGDQASPLSVLGLNLGGGSIEDGAGNALTTVSGGLGLQIDTGTPDVTSVSAQADNHATDLDAGHTVTITLTTSKPVVVDTLNGTPYLTLSNNTVATYSEGSGTNALDFTYVVQAGDANGSLEVTGLVLDNGTIESTAGTPLAGTVSGVLGLQVDTVAPTVQAVAAVADNQATDLNAGHVVTITVTTSEPVFVNTNPGTPTLSLSDGETAAYTGGSGTTALTFSYTVKPGDTTAGDDLQVSKLLLNNATIEDGAGNALVNSVSGDLGLQIDTSTPTTSLFATTVNNATDLKAGAVVTITLEATEPLYVNGPAALQLNNNEVADYTGGTGTQTLTFSYTVQPNDDTDDLQVQGIASNGGTITNQAGTTPPVAADLALQVDTTAPTVSSVVAATDNGATDLDAGRVVTITLDTSEPVFVTGTPALDLNDNAVATYSGGTGTSALTFTYVVQAGDSSDDLQVTGVDTTGGTIEDGAGNALTPVFAGDLGLTIDTTPPTVANVSAVSDGGAGGAGVLGANHTVTISVETSKPVFVDTDDGIPTLALNDNEVAVYSGGSGTDTLTFTYAIKPGDKTSDLQVTQLDANGGSITDGAGNPLTTVTGGLGLQIDAVTPSVTAIAANPSITALPGQTIAITVTLKDGVTVENGTPTLSLNDGGTATYDPTATAALDDPTKLIFDYTVSLNRDQHAGARSDRLQPPRRHHRQCRGDGRRPDRRRRRIARRRRRYAAAVEIRDRRGLEHRGQLDGGRRTACQQRRLC